MWTVMRCRVQGDVNQKEIGPTIVGNCGLHSRRKVCKYAKHSSAVDFSRPPCVYK